MTTHRFFVPSERVAGERVEFSEEQTRQIERVLRLRTGDRVVALDGAGRELEVEVDVVRPRAGGRIVATCPNRAEPAVNLHLYPAVLKGAKLELVLQKGTELGISEFVPIVTARSVASTPSESRQRRYEAIVREAVEQSGRGRVPRVAASMPFDKALHVAASRGPVVMLWEDEGSSRLGELPMPEGVAAVSVFVGPEGGFTPDEVARAREIGARTATLGRRILRAETAGIVGPALVLARLGELG